jgi:hypothetical protein
MEDAVMERTVGARGREGKGVRRIDAKGKVNEDV